MTSPRVQIRHFSLCLLWLIHAAVAQTSSPSPSLSIDELSQRAGLIFTATVVKIEESGQDSVVRITFKIEDGIRGVRSGDELTVREWSGAWNGAARYRVGEKLLLFLHD